MTQAKNEQIKSKRRVADHGEVFTAEREVNAMLDLVKQETERIDSTFLEPACGNGNFLAAILKRKLAVVDIIGKGKPGIWESESIKALMRVFLRNLKLHKQVQQFGLRHSQSCPITCQQRILALVLCLL